jgi:hypothetical protein
MLAALLVAIAVLLDSGPQAEARRPVRYRSHRQ